MPGTLEQPRIDNGRYTTKPQSVPELTLTDTPLDRGLLTPAEQNRFDLHLGERNAAGITNAETYSRLGPITGIAQAIVYGRRGTAPQLLWQMNVAGGEPVDVPVFVAKASGAVDVTDPVVPLLHRRNRARASASKATEQRARLAGRVSGPRLGELRNAEAAALAKLDAAEVELAASALPAHL